MFVEGCFNCFVRLTRGGDLCFFYQVTFYVEYVVFKRVDGGVNLTGLHDRLWVLPNARRANFYLRAFLRSFASVAFVCVSSGVVNCTSYAVAVAGVVPYHSAVNLCRLVKAFPQFVTVHIVNVRFVPSVRTQRFYVRHIRSVPDVFLIFPRDLNECVEE